MALAKRQHVQIHAIVFRLPFVENVYNVAKRKNHEGHFEGDSELHRQIIYYTRTRLLNGGHPRSVLFFKARNSSFVPFRDNNEGFNSVFECQSNTDYAFAFRQWMHIGKRGLDGERRSADNWFVKERPWRVTDPSELEETEAIVKKEAPWLSPPIFPATPQTNLDADQPSWRQETIGYAFLSVENVIRAFLAIFQAETVPSTFPKTRTQNDV